MNIIKKLFTKIFCNRCKYINDALIIIDDLREENHTLQKQVDHQLLLHQIATFNSLCENIVFVEENDNDYCIITAETEFDSRGLISGVNFYCYLLDCPQGVPRKVMYMFTEFSYIDKFNCIEKIEIVDIVGEPNKGYGSKIMHAFFNFIRPLKAKEIFGSLSYVDEKDVNNKSRRNHFYEKFGFEVKKSCIIKN